MSSGAYNSVLPDDVAVAAEFPVLLDDGDARYVPVGEGTVATEYTPHDAVVTGGIWSCIGVVLRSTDHRTAYLAHCSAAAVEDGRNRVVERFLQESSSTETAVDLTYAVSRPDGRDSAPGSTEDLIAATDRTLRDADNVSVHSRQLSYQDAPAGIGVRIDDEQLYSYAKNSVATTGPIER